MIVGTYLKYIPFIPQDLVLHSVAHVLVIYFVFQLLKYFLYTFNRTIKIDDWYYKDMPPESKHLLLPGVDSGTGPGVDVDLLDNDSRSL